MYFIKPNINPNHIFLTKDPFRRWDHKITVGNSAAVALRIFIGHLGAVETSRKPNTDIP